MIHITNFINKISLADSKQNTTVVLPINEARGLRDELTKLLLELRSASETKQQESKTAITNIEIKGGTFK